MPSENISHGKPEQAYTMPAKWRRASAERNHPETQGFHLQKKDFHHRSLKASHHTGPPENSPRTQAKEGLTPIAL
jgi:hypothetical protein